MDHDQLALLAVARALDSAFRTLSEMDTAAALVRPDSDLPEDIEQLRQLVRLDAEALHAFLARRMPASST